VSSLHRPILALATTLLSGCGVIAGTLIDTAEQATTYPLKEWVFMGAYRYDNAWEDPWEELPLERDDGEVLVGLCFSGGGSRSAMFATCVLDALGRTTIPGSQQTWLDEIDAISGVSGGSLAAAYYVLNRHRDGFPAGHEPFFQRMRADMGLDFELRAIGRLLFMGYGFPLVLTHYDRGDLMASVWDSNFFDGLTFGDLDPAAPDLLLNATCYDTGQKFVFTPLPLRSLNGAAWFQQKAADRLLTHDYGVGHVPFESLTFEALDSSVAKCPISTGVVASAAVPNLLGPITLRDHRWQRDLHLGDGGIYDNHGLEAMVQVMLRRLEDDPTRRAVILVVDGTGFFETGHGAGALDNVAAFSDRTVTIAWLRAASYAEPAYQDLKDRLQLRVISLYDETGLDEEPPVNAAQAFVRDLASKTASLVDDLNLRLRGVGTRFSLDDQAAADIERVAPRIVRAALERVDVEALRTPREPSASESPSED
jgi:predicted acylesterase/phospholipase RssA